MVPLALLHGTTVGHSASTTKFCFNDNAAWGTVCLVYYNVHFLGWVSPLGCAVFLWLSIVLFLPCGGQIFWSFVARVGVNQCFS